MRAVCRTGPQGFRLLGHRQASCGSSRTTCTRVQGHEKPVCSGHDGSRSEAECGEEGLGGSGQGRRMDEGSRMITKASDSRAVSNMGWFRWKWMRQGRPRGLNQRHTRLSWQIKRLHF